jgi:hypothetical protein
MAKRNKSAQQIEKESKNSYDIYTLHDARLIDFDYLQFKLGDIELEKPEDAEDLGWSNKEEKFHDPYEKGKTNKKIITESVMQRVEKLFVSDKFEKQREAMSLYFAGVPEENEHCDIVYRKLTQSEIAKIQGRLPSDVGASIRSGVNKIKKKLSFDDWESIRWYFREFKKVKSDYVSHWDKPTIAQYWVFSNPVEHQLDPLRDKDLPKGSNYYL